MATTVRFSFRQQWDDLKHGRPGRRFRECYRKARQHRERGGRVRRLVLIGAAIVCFLIGLFLSVFPGPAIPFFFLAGGLLATESKAIARLMDWCELRLRAIAEWLKGRWQRLSPAGRVALGMLAMCCSAGVTYAAFRVLFS